MLHPFLQRYSHAITRLCEQHGVEQLYAFGSVTSNSFDEERSDIDLLVELPAQLPPEQKGMIYFELLEQFQQLFGRKVDLLLAQPFRNPYFARSVEATKELLYAARYSEVFN